ncbi:MAG: archaetidylserine decarboxylase [Oligoflexales bacterium]
MSAFFSVLRFIPKNLISFLTGTLARVRLPWPLNRLACKLFVMAFKIDMGEAEFPLSQYKTVEDVFTRRLRADARKVTGPFCSPADGFLAASGPLANNKAIQAKGLDYSVHELVWGDAKVSFSGVLTDYVTVYLAPFNYHRVHSPVEGTLKKVRYIAGTLWPVNRPFVHAVSGIFVKNERLVFDIDTQYGPVFVVMVGALNVGRMTAAMIPSMVTNGFRRQFGMATAEFNPPQPAYKVSCGSELGTFCLGSTVVVVLSKEFSSRVKSVRNSDFKPIMLGQSLIES